MDQKNLALIRFRQRFQQTSRCKLRFPQSTPKSNTTFRAYRQPVGVSSMPIALKQNFGYPGIEKSRCILEGPQNAPFAVTQVAQTVVIEPDFRRSPRRRTTSELWADYPLKSSVLGAGGACSRVTRQAGANLAAVRRFFEKISWPFVRHCQS